jgi:hypothetical protein
MPSGMAKVHVHMVEKKLGYFETLCKLEALGNVPLRMDDEDFVKLGTEWISELGLHIGIEKATLDLKEGEFLGHDCIVFLVRVW